MGFTVILVVCINAAYTQNSDKNNFQLVHTLIVRTVAVQFLYTKNEFLFLIKQE